MDSELKAIIFVLLLSIPLNIMAWFEWRRSTTFEQRKARYKAVGLMSLIVMGSLFLLYLTYLPGNQKFY